MKRRRLRLLSLLALGAGAAWAVPRRWLLPAALGAALGPAPAQAQPAEEDVAMMQKLPMDHGGVPPLEGLKL